MGVKCLAVMRTQYESARIGVWFFFFFFLKWAGLCAVFKWFGSDELDESAVGYKWAVDFFFFFFVSCGL